VHLAEIERKSCDDHLSTRGLTSRRRFGKIDIFPEIRIVTASASFVRYDVDNEIWRYHTRPGRLFVFLSIRSARILCAGSIGKIEFTREIRHRRRRPPRWRTWMIYASASRDMELNIQSLGKRELAFHNPDSPTCRDTSTYARQEEREREKREARILYVQRRKCDDR